MIGRYLIPLAPFLLITIVCVVFLFYFVYFQHELRTTKKRAEQARTANEDIIAELRNKVADLTDRVLDAEDRAGVLVPPTPPKSGLNLNRRTQAIRMSRRGEQADKIAATLCLPRREVELLLKVQRCVVYDSTKPSS
jgi:hypothetical protein